jgi:signal transduction histidine kinase
MAYKKAEEQGQQISYRNVQPTAPAAEEADKIAVVGRPQESSRPPAAEEARISASEQQLEPLDKGAPEDAEVPAQAERRPAPPRPDRGSAEEARRLKSIFVSQPLRLSEIVAGGGNGIVPLAVDGGLRLLYWQRETEGNVIGCLVAAGQLRDRIVGSIPNIYSASRILTVLDEKGQPLFVPAGQEGRDWRKPFVAREISEILPGWEAAAYLADPEVISARARVTTSLTWLLIFIMFASIVAGGVLVLRSASAELKLAQQKTTFVANVSHELKTPLTSIRMFAEMLRDGRQSDERKRQQYFSIMTAETERLTRLINNVLDFARSEQGKKRYTMRECDLAGLAASIVESQRARWENNGFKVVFTAGSDPVVVSADEEALKQAVINLLSNAEKYSDQVKEIEVTVGEECGSAVVGVSDRGIGIPTGEAERIFSEFYRVDDALTARVKGTGLGLTIARRIARDHGGDVVHSARPGGGSTFRIVLPLRAERQ